MKRSGRGKRYEDLQSVSVATVAIATTSCAVMSSCSVPNSTQPGVMAPPTARLPLKMATKETGSLQYQGWASGTGSWTQGENSDQEQPWSTSSDAGGHTSQDASWTRNGDQGQGGQNQHWEAERERGPEPGWVSDSDRGGPTQEWNSSHSWQNPSQSHGNIWRPDMHLKKVQPEGNHQVHDFPQPPGGSTSCSDGHKDDSKPLIIVTKKEPPTFPPGSEEERWQLQIVAKGRVTCPKCKSVNRKTVDGLKKHMENCRLQPFSCQHCGKQLRSSTGMRYHIMADHSHLPSTDVDDRAAKDKLRKVLKRLGRLRCSREGCGASFSSIMGYVYHMKKCGKEAAELEKMLLSCSHCGKTYKSKAGLEYHLKSEHTTTPFTPEEDESLREFKESNPEKTATGRVQRASAQVANFNLAEIANNEPPKDWPKRKFQSDLVPDDKKLKYLRPGLPSFSLEVLRKWKNEVKLQRKVQCPNPGCGCVYSSVSGLKAHLGLCSKGDFQAGKYQCLICHKEFLSESGVKYHINTVHSQEWFVTNKKASRKLHKFLQNHPPSSFPHPHHPHPHFLQCPHLTPLTVWAEQNHKEESPGPEQAPIDCEVTEEVMEEVMEEETEEVMEEETEEETEGVRTEEET